MSNVMAQGKALLCASDDLSVAAELLELSVLSLFRWSLAGRLRGVLKTLLPGSAWPQLQECLW